MVSISRKSPVQTIMATGPGYLNYLILQIRHCFHYGITFLCLLAVFVQDFEIRSVVQRFFFSYLNIFPWPVCISKLSRQMLKVAFCFWATWQVVVKQNGVWMEHLIAKSFSILLLIYLDYSSVSVFHKKAGERCVFILMGRLHGLLKCLAEVRIFFQNAV